MSELRRHCTIKHPNTQPIQRSRRVLDKHRSEEDKRAERRHATKMWRDRNPDLYRTRNNIDSFRFSLTHMRSKTALEAYNQVLTACIAELAPEVQDKLHARISARWAETIELKVQEFRAKLTAEQQLDPTNAGSHSGHSQSAGSTGYPQHDDDGLDHEDDGVSSQMAWPPIQDSALPEGLMSSQMTHDPMHPGSSLHDHKASEL